MIVETSRSPYSVMARVRGIGVAVNYRAVHLLQYFTRQFGCRRGDLPVAEAIGDRTVSLPFYTQLTDRQIRRIIQAVTELVAPPHRPLRPAAAQPSAAHPSADTPALSPR